MHPEYATAPEGKELLIYCEVWPWAVVGLAILDDFVPNVPDVRKAICLEPCRPGGRVIKPKGPDDKGEATFAEVTPVEGAPVNVRPHLHCSQMVVLTCTTHYKDTNEGLQFHQPNILEGDLVCILEILPQLPHLVRRKYADLSQHLVRHEKGEDFCRSFSTNGDLSRACRFHLSPDDTGHRFILFGVPHCLVLGF